MVRLIDRSNLRLLADELCNRLDRLHPKNPLQPLDLIIPNRDTARWLSLEIARRRGIAGNYQFWLPAEWIWNSIRKYRPELPETLPFDPGPMSWTLFRILTGSDIWKKVPELNDLKKRDRESSDRQFIWSISKEIADVFEQYQIYRPEMLNRWEERRETPEEAGWQPGLWRYVTSGNIQISGKEGAPLHRGELLLELESRVDSGGFGLRGPLVLFHVGLLPPPVMNILYRLGKSSELYQFRLTAGATLKLEDRLDTPQNPLLEAFGTEQFEMDQLILKYAKDNRNTFKPDLQSDPQYRSSEHSVSQLSRNHSLDNHSLSRIQEAVAAGRPLSKIDPGDGSIIIRSCHSPLREVEELYQFILRLFDGESTLNPGEICVVTPDLEGYRPFIESVFGSREEGLPDLPYFIAGTDRNKGSGAIRLFRNFLELLPSRISTRDTVDFLSHRPLMDRYRFSESDLAMIESWVEEMNVVWGLSASHREKFGQPATESQTWERAMRRGWLGQLTDEYETPISSQLLLYPCIDTSEKREVWAGLQTFIRFLRNAIDQADQNHSPAGWKELLTGWVDHLVPDSGNYERERATLLLGIDQLTDEMEMGEVDEIPYQLIVNALNSILDHDSKPVTSFTDGIIFNSMVPVRGVPFKVVALLGLNDDLFPRKDRRAGYNLMGVNRRTGEKEKKNEDRSLFLESLLSANEIHYCSYTGRNQTDDQPIPPSSVLAEWIQCISDAGNCDEKRFVRQESLNGFSSRYFTSENPESYSEIYFEIAQKNLHTAEDSPASGLMVDTKLSLPDEDAEFLEFDELIRFYSHPVRYFFNDRFGIFLKEVKSDDFEEFTIDFLNDFILLNHSFHWKLLGIPDDTIDRFIINSDYLPAGWPGEQLQYRFRSLKERAFQTLSEKGFNPDLLYRDLDLTVGKRRIKGRIRSYSRQKLLDLHFFKFSGKRVVASWLRHLICCLMDQEECESWICSGLRNGDIEWWRFRYEPNADKILAELCELYDRGRMEPLNLCLKSSWEYAFHIEDEKKAIREASKAWGSSFGGSPENEDQYLKFLLGEDAALDKKQLHDTWNQLFKPIINRLEKVE